MSEPTPSSVADTHLSQLVGPDGDRKVALKGLGSCLCDVKGSIERWITEVLKCAMHDPDESVRKVAKDVLVDVCDPEEYMHLLLQTLHTDQDNDGITHTLQFLVGICEEVEDHGPR